MTQIVYRDTTDIMPMRGCLYRWRPGLGQARVWFADRSCTADPC